MKEAHKSQDIASIDTAMTELNAAWTAASQDIYNAQQGGAQPGAQPEGGNNGNGEQSAGANANADNVTDVPYEEVK